MSEVNGVLKEQTQQDGVRPPTSGRVTSASMMRSGTFHCSHISPATLNQYAVMSSSESSPSSESIPWSSAIGHAGTGKSGRVIERLQGDIDRLRREKQLLKMRHEEVEKANEALVSRNQSLQDRNSNYEQSHEANLRQLARKERQVEDLREDLRKEKLKTAKAEAQAQTATANEEIWRNQSSQARALAAQRETEYDTIVACRKVDYDRHQSGLDKIRAGFDTLLQRREDDLEKQKKLEIIAEQQRQTISQLEDLTRRLTTNFKAYRHEIDAAIADLRETANSNDQAVTRKLDEMTQVTGRMRWVMNIEDLVNHNHRGPPPPPSSSPAPNSIGGHSAGPDPRHPDVRRRSLSPTKGLLTKHRRKDSAKLSK